MKLTKGGIYAVRYGDQKLVFVVIQRIVRDKMGATWIEWHHDGIPTPGFFRTNAAVFVASVVDAEIPGGVPMEEVEI